MINKNETPKKHREKSVRGLAAVWVRNRFDLPRMKDAFRIGYDAFAGVLPIKDDDLRSRYLDSILELLVTRLDPSSNTETIAPEIREAYQAGFEEAEKRSRRLPPTQLTIDL